MYVKEEKLLVPSKLNYFSKIRTSVPLKFCTHQSQWRVGAKNTFTPADPKV